MFWDAAGRTVSLTARLSDSDALGILGFTFGADSKPETKIKTNQRKKLTEEKHYRKIKIKQQSVLFCVVTHVSPLLNWMDCSTGRMKHRWQPNQSQTLWLLEGTFCVRGKGVLSVQLLHWQVNCQNKLSDFSERKQEFVQTFEQCSAQTLPTLWWRREARLGSCLLLHRSHSSVETPAGLGAESPPPAADSCHLQNSLLHSDASTASNIEEQQLHNHDCLSVQQVQLKLET